MEKTPVDDLVKNTGKWLRFLVTMSEQGYEAVTPHVVQEKTEPVALRCTTHPDSPVQSWSQRKLGLWMGSCKRTCFYAPPCEACAVVYRGVHTSKHQADRQDTAKKFDERLAVFGHRIENHVPTSVYDPVTKKVLGQKSEVECMHCHHKRFVYLSSTLQSAENRGHMGCPVCSPVKSGPRSKEERVLSQQAKDLLVHMEKGGLSLVLSPEKPVKRKKANAFVFFAGEEVAPSFVPSTPSQLRQDVYKLRSQKFLKVQFRPQGDLYTLTNRT